MTEVFSVATVSIESARKLDLQTEFHSSDLHGHHFQITAHARIPSGWSSFTGDECPEMRRRLQSCLKPLDYSLLNDRIAEPTDENIARWVFQNLDVPGVDRVSVQSTPMQGVHLSGSGEIHIWRRYAFQAAHQLPNVPVGHKCGRLHGHSFEVLLHVRQDVDVSKDPVRYHQIDVFWQSLAEELDFRYLNEIVGLENPTSEHLAAWIWRRLNTAVSGLSSVSVFETNSCGANFDGASYRIWKEFTLDSAVRLDLAPTGSLLRQVHGHTYALRLHVCAPLDQVLGWTVDFGDVKAIFDPIYRALDHSPLFELDGMAACDAASIADWIFRSTHVKLPQLVQVDLYETQGCGASIAPGNACFFLRV